MITFLAISELHVQQQKQTKISLEQLVNLYCTVLWYAFKIVIKLGIGPRRFVLILK